MKKKILFPLLHIFLFVFIEMLFVFIILHEFPKINFSEDLGIIHLLYWIILFSAGYIRQLVNSYKLKFLATYTPVVLHAVGHLYIGNQMVSHIKTHAHGEEFWLVISTIILGIFIFFGEYLLHRKRHCDHYHAEIHKHCKKD